MVTICFQSPSKPIHNIQPKSKLSSQPPYKSQSLVIVTEPEPVFTSVKTFAPATVANLGPGFDFLGCAVDGLGDHVTLHVDPTVRNGEISISEITGTTTKLSFDPHRNCAGIAAMATMKMLGIKSVGVSLALHKGLPLGSGLGSSAASAAAAAVAVNELFGGKLGNDELVLAGLKSEAKVSGFHADNIAPAIMGGFVLIRSYEPLDLKPLRFPLEKDLFFVLVSPDFEAPTKKMRAALAKEIPMAHHVWNSSQAAVLVAAVLEVEPKRAPLIPGMEAVKRAALEAGAFGCTISGVGPTAVAVIDTAEKGFEIGEKMVEAFLKVGNLKSIASVKKLDKIGARLIKSM
ncbi:hypothetical protein ARALYDRAFT_353299 [Arabidopsis lyrata subsp. lyrata]|uniref:Homoserine kinase n=1 Tax=Arabidopsis lyrata subsp. lyrata TaxID=81972 RepID=D7MD19_ARALL|nr:hypothetical protein ARALYDRAFT_353299 [Arabidopsis lyrata subsp. lyrata]